MSLATYYERFKLFMAHTAVAVAYKAGYRLGHKDGRRYEATHPFLRDEKVNLKIWSKK